MIKSKAYEYFITQDHNCAETSLLAIRDAYGLDIGPEEMKLVSAFGGGMGCGKLCGVLAGSMAALRPALCRTLRGLQGRSRQYGMRGTEAHVPQRRGTLPQDRRAGSGCV